jgi:aryl-alcohol dehydrogenase-like predicted oxidoreductase
METRMLGRLWPVSALTLGGGGVGQLWGPTTRDECIATVRTAVDCGITLLDMAPAYGNGEAESVVAAAFDGRLPAGLRVTTKHRLGTPPAGEVEGNIVRSLDESLARMRLERVDLFFLHSNIIPDDCDASAYVDRPATRWTTYIEHFIPTCERLVADGRIGAWGITGIGIPECVLAALSESSRPAAIQCITNPLDSPGELKYFAGPSRAREIIAASRNGGAGVLGIRPVQVERSPIRSTGIWRRIMVLSRTSDVALLSARSPTNSARRRRRSPTATRCRCPASTQSCSAARTARRF